MSQISSAKQPSAVIFDMGGVLIDWNPRHLYRKLIPDAAEMERFLAEVTTNAWHVPQDHGGDPAEATRRLQLRHPDKTELIAAFYGRFDEMLDHAIPGMAHLVERLHAAKVRLVLLSNAPAFLEAWLRGTGRSRHRFMGLFGDYVVSGAVGCAKPQAAIYELACRRGGVAPGEAVFIDDSPANVEGARAAGLYGIHHRSVDETA
ncbi:MAG TPA: HAD family phosphatase, partial [Reyranellaceae bacterium]|nr:HAD family phosphatase [Reyranellaceae bacterium]